MATAAGPSPAGGGGEGGYALAREFLTWMARRRPSSSAAWLWRWNGLCRGCQHRFERLVREHKAERGAKGFSCRARVGFGRFLAAKIAFSYGAVETVNLLAL